MQSFNPDDPEDLAKKIIWVLNNDCTQIVNQATRDVSEYTWDKMSISNTQFFIIMFTFQKILKNLPTLYSSLLLVLS